MANDPKKFTVRITQPGAGRIRGQAPQANSRKPAVLSRDLEIRKLEGDPLYLFGADGAESGAATDPGAPPVAGVDAAPESAGDRLIFRRRDDGTSSIKVAIGVDEDGTLWFQSNEGTGGGSNCGFDWYSGGITSTSIRRVMRLDDNRRLNVGDANEPHSTLTIAGPIATSVLAISGAVTAAATDSEFICDAAGAAFTIDLPTAVGITGRRYWFKRINMGANNVTVDASGAQTIDGVLTKQLASQYAAMEIVSDGANWHIRSQMGTII